LQLAGDGELRPYLASLAKKLRIEESVQFLGQLKEQELIDCFRKASLFMFTSEAEGMPMVLLEAQSCGLPVVTSAFDSARTLIDHGVTGFIVNGYEISLWLDKLNLLYEDKELRDAFSKNARQRIIKSFTWEQTSSMILTCFHDVLIKK
jgi:glycosyltransferase involved in cell wall biosynthesis